uniref:PSI subunit V n=1 Tax=Asterionellopsis glacialis TaxID=33640 RepID=A0A7S0PWW7_9STRA|mmetsp:Transcript_1814/g.2616  ORF Transcript_1814/g.2616 Transcript_1814/m.2616 type:complete len:349 (+) Transcript_1814:231-1277(+)
MVQYTRTALSCLLLFAPAFTTNGFTTVLNNIHPSSSRVLNTNDVAATFTTSSAVGRQSVILEAAKKKKRRKRKQQPSSSDAEVPSSDETTSSSSYENTSDTLPTEISQDEPLSPDDIAQMKDIASFQFVDDDNDLPITNDGSDAPGRGAGGAKDALVLPNIRDTLKKKAMEEEVAKQEAEEAAKTPKIKRSDRVAFEKLLEQDPYADSDPAFFEEEEYGTVSALLGERAKPFLSIPFGPLQVGHFIGALGIVLMGFVEYPGFPLTNLPTPLRGALQGGLGTVYAINTVLAILAIFKASERGQPPALWAAKCFGVGGLAFDQLTQLPTTEQLERVKNQKGARALKNRKR